MLTAKHSPKAKRQLRFPLQITMRGGKDLISDEDTARTQLVPTAWR
jgi:hypothetical protein